MKVTLVSLGCPENQVDSDIIAHGLLKAGHTTTADMTEADVCVINTCGFITSAKEEAIENIFNAVGARLENPKLKIVVTGCLAQRFGEEVKAELPEIDVVLGIGENIVFINKGKCDWIGDSKTIFKSDSQSLNDFVFASHLFKEVKSYLERRSE